MASVASVLAVIERLLPGGSAHFQLSLSSSNSKTQPACFSITDEVGGGSRISISASDVSTLSAGVGYHLREHCNMTIGWARGGGSSGVQVPKHWPTMASIGGNVTRCRLVDHLYFMNVCTHSYSLVWYGWSEWQQMLDWMSLSGFNNFLALTGQEEVAYRAFTSIGLNDTEVVSDILYLCTKALTSKLRRLRYGQRVPFDSRVGSGAGSTALHSSLGRGDRTSMVQGSVAPCRARS